MADLAALKRAVFNGEPTAAELTRQALAEGVGAEKVLKEGLIAGMEEVGEAFKRSEIYVPEVLIAARAMKMALEVLGPKLAEAGVKPLGTVVIGTVQGDLHDIGKNLVAMMLKGAGFQVVDLGTDVKPGRFLEAAAEHGAKLAGMSALLTTTMPNMEKTIGAFREAGGAVKVMIGGAPVTQEYANKIGADGWAADAATAVDLAKRLMGL